MCHILRDVTYKNTYSTEKRYIDFPLQNNRKNESFMWKSQTMRIEREQKREKVEEEEKKLGNWGKFSLALSIYLRHNVKCQSDVSKKVIFKKALWVY